VKNKTTHAIVIPIHIEPSFNGASCGIIIQLGAARSIFRGPLSLPFPSLAYYVRTVRAYAILQPRKARSEFCLAFFDTPKVSASFFDNKNV